MDTTSLNEVIWATLAAFAGFEVALAINYLMLKWLLLAMQFGLRPAMRSARSGLQATRSVKPAATDAAGGPPL